MSTVKSSSNETSTTVALFVVMALSAMSMWVSGYTAGLTVAKNRADCQKMVETCSKEKLEGACLFEVYYAEDASCNRSSLRP